MNFWSQSNQKSMKERTIWVRMQVDLHATTGTLRGPCSTRRYSVCVCVCV